MFFCQPPKCTMAQYFSQPFPKPGRNVFTLLCILFVCPPLQPRGPPRSRERQRLLDPCIGDGEVGVGAVRHGPVEVEGREVAVLVQVDRGLHRQHDVPGGKDACVQSGAAGCVKGFVTCFLKVPLPCSGCMAAAVQPNCLWNSQKIFYKTFYSTSCPSL